MTWVDLAKVWMTLMIEKRHNRYEPVRSPSRQSELRKCSTKLAQVYALDIGESAKGVEEGRTKVLYIAQDKCGKAAGRRKGAG
ncbi:uncharacterized protein MEPE_05308 [Melanopsichium pennsylvanicum]|uniref:Uncharacterized protein n=1 Tax=Melanopsichium pennsylvanicum TaxID=63383 RepID=A0AAJ4XQG4_9BASI|nr:uncharacterized protein MEPE_05308 [Melanopsichium pennsylvanicum]